MRNPIPWRAADEAEPALRTTLDALKEKHWLELAGVKLVMAYPVLVAVGNEWKKAPLAVEEVSAALRASPVDLKRADHRVANGQQLESEGDGEGEGEAHTLDDELLALYEHATGAKVTWTEQELRWLTEDQPGPEVIRSGTIGEVGLAAWRAPRREEGRLVFYANLPRKDGADFVRVSLELGARRFEVERVDDGWFETAVDLSYFATKRED